MRGVEIVKTLQTIYGKRIIIMGGGAQVGQVAIGAVSEADRHNIRGEHISVDTIPLVGEQKLADAVRAVARLPRAKALVLAGSLMGGEIETAVREVRQQGPAGHQPEHGRQCPRRRRPGRHGPRAGRRHGRHGRRRHRQIHPGTTQTPRLLAAPAPRPLAPHSRHRGLTPLSQGARLSRSNLPPLRRADRAVSPRVSSPAPVPRPRPPAPGAWLPTAAPHRGLTPLSQGARLSRSQPATSPPRGQSGQSPGLGPRPRPPAPARPRPTPAPGPGGPVFYPPATSTPLLCYSLQN